MSSPFVVVVGAGPGVGAAVARRFARAGYQVGLVSRSPERLEALAAELADSGVRASWRAADLTDETALTAAVQSLGESAGRIDVLHFNPSAYREEDPLHLSPGSLLEDVHLGVGALLTAVQAGRPYLRPGGRITATGSAAADRPWHRAASLGVQKAGLRNLVHSIDATLAPEGVRAVSVTVDGVLAPDGPFAPDRVAEAIHAAATRSDEAWTTEVTYTG